MRLRAGLFALSTFITGIPLCAGAADQIEIVLTGAGSARGIGGNEVCRIHMQIKNRSAFRLERLTFTLGFAGLSTRALGGTGVTFLSPDSLGSDREEAFVATWHEGRCQAAHYQLPTLVVDVCAVGALPERECKALFTMRSQVRKPGAFFTPADFKVVNPALNDENMQGVDCARLADPASTLLVSAKSFILGTEEVWGVRASTREYRVDRAAGLYLSGSGSGTLEVRNLNGFNTSFFFPSYNPQQQLHKFDRSINISDVKYNLPGEYRYKLTKSGSANATATVTRTVTELGTPKAGDCAFHAVFVQETTEEDTGRVHEEAAYVWYPELKLRLDRFVKGQYIDGKGLLPLDPRYVNYVMGLTITSLKISN